MLTETYTIVSDLEGEYTAIHLYLFGKRIQYSRSGPEPVQLRPIKFFLDETGQKI